MTTEIEHKIKKQMTAPLINESDLGPLYPKMTDLQAAVDGTVIPVDKREIGAIESLAPVNGLEISKAVIREAMNTLSETPVTMDEDEKLPTIEEAVTKDFIDSKWAADAAASARMATVTATTAAAAATNLGRNVDVLTRQVEVLRNFAIGNAVIVAVLLFHAFL